MAETSGDYIVISFAGYSEVAPRICLTKQGNKSISYILPTSGLLFDRTLCLKFRRNVRGIWETGGNDLAISQGPVFCSYGTVQS